MLMQFANMSPCLLKSGINNCVFPARTSAVCSLPYPKKYVLTDGVSALIRFARLSDLFGVAHLVRLGGKPVEDII